MTIIFKLKTTEAYTIKILSELLQNTIKTACIEVSSAGLSLRQMDSLRKILIDISIDSKMMSKYIFKSASNMSLGLNLSHLYKMLKTVKKKDSIELFIDDEDTSQLQIVVYPKENNRITKSSILIQNIQSVNIPLPEGYSRPVNIPSGEYQKTMKDMNTISSIVDVSVMNCSAKFKCSSNQIFSREVTFGELDELDDPVVFEDKFDMEQFVRILKIAGLSKFIQVYGCPGLPLLINSKIGILGDLNIYIKSITQIEEDSGE
jgi:proliferating cell nuclear antigen